MRYPNCIFIGCLVSVGSDFKVLLMHCKTVHSIAPSYMSDHIIQQFHLLYYAFKMQGSWRFPGLRRSWLAAGLFPMYPRDVGSLRWKAEGLMILATSKGLTKSGASLREST